MVPHININSNHIKNFRRNQTLLKMLIPAETLCTNHFCGFYPAAVDYVPISFFVTDHRALTFYFFVILSSSTDIKSPATPKPSIT